MFGRQGLKDPRFESLDTTLKIREDNLQNANKQKQTNQKQNKCKKQIKSLETLCYHKLNMNSALKVLKMKQSMVRFHLHTVGFHAPVEASEAILPLQLAQVFFSHATCCPSS